MLGVSRNKIELEEIADTLKIDILGTEAILLTCINGYFNAHPHFKEDKCFCGLFGCVFRSK